MITKEDLEKWRRLVPRAEPLDLGNSVHRQIVCDWLIDHDRVDDVLLIEGHGDLPGLWHALERGLNRERKPKEPSRAVAYAGIRGACRVVTDGVRWSHVRKGERDACVAELLHRGHHARTVWAYSPETRRKVLALEIDGRVLSGLSQLSDAPPLPDVGTPDVQRILAKLRKDEGLQIQERQGRYRWWADLVVWADDGRYLTGAIRFDEWTLTMHGQEIPAWARQRVQRMYDLVEAWRGEAQERMALVLAARA